MYTEACIASRTAYLCINAQSCLWPQLTYDWIVVKGDVRVVSLCGVPQIYLTDLHHQP